MSSDSIFEAVKVRDNTDNPALQVRAIPIEDFARNTSKIRQYIRPDNLTNYQLEKLESFVRTNSEKRYTTIHAGLTAFIPLMRNFLFFSGVLAFISIHRNEPDGCQKWPAILFIWLLLYGIYALFKWSYRLDCKVKLLSKGRLGHWLDDNKDQMFCSKLVLLAEREIDEFFVSHLPNENEIQPKHIANACEKLGWKKVDFDLSPRN